jgi:hypothetical protein
MNSIGQRGKAAEKEVRVYLERLSFKYAGFAYERIYDARSARGKFPARAGDFEFYASRLHGLIEAKEVEHDFRLPNKNLKKEQIARLRKRQLAGGLVFVLINHTTSGLWRSVPVEWLHERSAQPSWDLSEFPTLPSAAAALVSLDEYAAAAAKEWGGRAA